jgi:hypothetical protein
VMEEAPSANWPSGGWAAVGCPIARATPVSRLQARDDPSGQAIGHPRPWMCGLRGDGGWIGERHRWPAESESRDDCPAATPGCAPRTRPRRRRLRRCCAEQVSRYRLILDSAPGVAAVTPILSSRLLGGGVRHRSRGLRVRPLPRLARPASLLRNRRSPTAPPSIRRPTHGSASPRLRSRSAGRRAPRAE